MIPTKTLSRFILSEKQKHPASTGEFSDLLVSISLGVKIIGQKVANAGVRGLTGYSGITNVHGESTLKLDQEADQVLVDLLGSSGHFGLLVSEERNTVVETSQSSADAKYVVAFDPLDGSSNIGTNIPTGTIFTIFAKTDLNRPANQSDFLQSGRKIVAAGYSVYGAMTSFVYSAGFGVHSFTLDQTIGEFILDNQAIKIPDGGSIYSINEANAHFWPSGVGQFISEIKSSNKADSLNYTARYVGSLVADFDRTIRKGGIFLYPRDTRRPEGRLRLVYECLPLAFIMEQAGGIAVDAETPVLDRVPDSIHARSGFVAGSKREVQWYQRVLGYKS